MAEPEKTNDSRPSQTVTLRIFDVVFVVVVFAYVVLIVLGKVNSGARLGWQEFVLIIFVVLFVRGFFNRIADVSFGKEGFRLQLNQIKEGQQVLKEGQDAIVQNLQTQMADVRRALNGIVTKFELRHLVALNSQEAYVFQFDPGPGGRVVYDEIRRLDGLNFVRPKMGKELYMLSEIVGTDSGPVDLKDFIEITDDGKTYLRARQSAD